jgi:acyl carrier protein
LQPLPVDVAGELCLAGECLARGYLNRPALTAEKFVRHPFRDDPSARLYRTGDRCVQRPDGVIKFLGRLDAQLKIRGFRIEPGEIETALSSHATVREVVVTARADPPGDLRLVAYVVPAGGPVPTPEAERDFATSLRLFLVTRLPAYLVPEIFVVLPALPRLPNGKVNASALPAPAVMRSVAGNTAAPPVTATEKILAAIWCDVLHVTSVGPADNFFALGGQSLLAIRIVARVRAAFHVELPMRHVFETANLAALAGLIEDQLLAQIAALTDAEALHESTAIAVK